MSTERRSPQRADSRLTQTRIVDGVRTYVDEYGQPPARLADIAEHTGISLATLYRHFTSIDDVIRAHVIQLPLRAVEVNRAADGDSAEEALHHWNVAWVRACLEFGPTAVNLRSRRGFLERRAANDPSVVLVCEQVEPLLARLSDDVLSLLLVWNAVSDPREVLDLNATRRWSKTRIARFITDTTLAVARSHSSPHSNVKR